MKKDTVVSLKKPVEESDSLSSLLREGARSLLHDAVEAKLATYLSGCEGERDAAGRRCIVRNGYLPARSVLTGLGEALAALLGEQAQGLCAEQNWHRLRGFKHLADMTKNVKFIDDVKEQTPPTTQTGRLTMIPYTGLHNLNLSPTHSFILFLVALLYVFFSSPIDDLRKIRETKEKIIDSENWSSTMGIVLNSGVIHNTEPYFFIFETYGYQPKIQYSYSVDGKKYTSQNHWHDNDIIYSIEDSHLYATLHNGMTIKRYIEKYYQVNRNVNVFYNPANPSESVLEIYNYAAFNTLYFTTIFTYLAAFIYVLYYCKKILFNRNNKKRRLTKKSK